MKARALLLAAGLVGLSGAIAAEIDPAGPYETSLTPTPISLLDHYVFARLQYLGIQPAKMCSDAAFVRRVFLDTIGTLPTPEETVAFLADKSVHKRRDLIERLLARDEFADYWAMKWCDVLRVKAEFPINLWPNAVQAYHRWIHTSIVENKPYDRFVRELLVSSGSNFRAPTVNFYRAMQNKDPQGIAHTVALTFMGARAEKWPRERLDGMAAFFSQVGHKSTAEWKEEIIFFDPAKPITGAPMFPDGTPARLTPGRDPREAFADWLISPRNPWFTAAIANRVWAWFFGRGIVDEPDDLRADNPPRNAELLMFLQVELIRARYDLKHLYRLILNSRAYQLSPIPRSKHPQAGENFAFYPTRRIEAEVLIDALNQITGTTEHYASAIPEPFTFIPENQRAIALADGSITSPFLELFGRSQRDTGLADERNNRHSAAQRLHMLNSSQVQRKIEQGPKMQAILRSKDDVRQKTTALYLAILSRYPTEEELKVATEYTQPTTGGDAGSPADIAWALINSDEFLHRH
jgi:hypothetical protein